MAKLELELLIKDAQAASSVGDIRKQLKDLKSAMLTVGEDSEEFNKLAQAAASLKDRVEEANEKIESMNPDKFKGLNQMASGAATGIQLATASMSLLGVESEDAQKAMMRVQAAMAFAQAINDIDKLKKGFQAFNAAVSANPIVAVTLALVALGTAIYKVWSAQQDANSELAKATREYEKQKKVTAELVREKSQEVELLEAQGASTEKVIAAKRQMIAAQIAEAEASILVNQRKVEEVKTNDSLWESLMRTADVVNGTNNSEAAIAINKKERAAESLQQIEDQKIAIDELKHQLELLDVQEEQAAEKKKEDNVKAYVDKKAIKDQELIDQKALNDQMIWENERLGEELIAQMEAENAAQDALIAEHDQHRLQMYNADRLAKYNAWKKADDAIKEGEKKAQKREEMINDWRINSIKSTLSIASELFKNNANAQKAISAATTLVDTYVAAQKAYVSQIIPLDPSSVVRAQIAAGIAIVSGLARVAAIMRVDTSGASASSGGGGASVGGGGSLTVSSQPNVSSGSQPSTLLTEQGNVANQQSQNPIYVSVQEIRQTSNDVQTIEERSRF